MRHIVHKMRQRSRESRERWLVGITGVTFVLLLGLWMVMLDARDRERQAVKEIKKVDTPFSILGDGIQDAVDTVKK